MLSRLFRPTLIGFRSSFPSSLSVFSSSSCIRSFSSSSPSASAAAASATPVPPPEAPPTPSPWQENPHGIGLNLESEEENFIGQPLHRIPGPFGTMQKPAIVFSEYHSRIVGCQGGAGQPHSIQFFELKRGPKHVCIECGQVFQLQATPENNPAANSVVLPPGSVEGGEHASGEQAHAQQKHAPH